MSANVLHEDDTRPLHVVKKSKGQPLSECVTAALETYFSNLSGHPPADLYRLVMAEVEHPLLEAVLKHTGGNQTRAAEVLGLNRGTLRKKLKQYGLGQ